MKNSIALFLIIFSLPLNGQILFKHTYGIGNINECAMVIQTSDLGYAVAGSTTPFSGGQTDFYLLKTDSMGNPIFQYSYGGIGIDHAKALIQLPDSGFILAGYTNSNVTNNDYDVLLSRTDKQGNQLWAKTMGTGNWDFIYDMKLGPDGNILLAGNTYGSGNGLSAGLLIKLDTDGNILWQKFVEQNKLVQLTKLAVKSDGSFSVCGNVSNTTLHAEDAFVAFLDSAGDTLKTVIVDFGKQESFNAIEFYSNGDLALAGNSVDSALSDNSDELIVRMDPNGNNLWAFSFFQDEQDYNYDLCLVNDTLFTAGATSSSGQGKLDFHVVKFNPNGQFVPTSTNTFGGNQDDICYSIYQTADRGFILAGTTASFGPGQQSILLIKSDSLFGFLTVPNVTIDIPETEIRSDISIYPNPSSGRFILDNMGKSENCNIRICDMHGKLIHMQNTFNFPVEMNLDLLPGIYLIEVISENKTFRKKIICH